MVLHIVVEEEEIEEVLVVVRTEVVEEVSKLVVANLDNQTDQTQAEEKEITRVR